MKKTWLSLALCMGLSLTGTAHAADSTVVGVGTGAVAGAVVGGPVGAVIGAVAGGIIGSNTASTRTRHQRRARYHSRRRAAEHGVSAPSPQRPPVIRTGSASLPEPGPVSEVSTAPVAATGSTQRGWRDPR